MKIKMKHYILLLIMVKNYVNAENLGVYGKVWPIKEIDLRKIIQEQGNKLDFSSIKSKIFHDISSWGNNNSHYGQLNENFDCRYYSPAVSLNNDIIIQGKLIYKKGQIVNPLHYVRPVTNMLFINGKLPQDEDLIKYVYHTYREKIMIVLTNGNPIKLSKHLKIPLFFGYPALLKRFHIDGVPTLLGIGSGHYRYQLFTVKLTSQNAADDIKRYWYGC